MEGLTGICHYLGLLDPELQGMEVLAQIQTDVFGLERQVCSYARTMNCPVQERPTAGRASIRFLVTQLYTILDKVQSYLEEVLLHEDMLKVC